MTSVRFHVVIGEDRLIRVPENISLGEAEVIVLQKEGKPSAESPGLRGMIDRLAGAAQEEGITGLPADLAEHHDQYAHGRREGTDLLLARIKIGP